MKKRIKAFRHGPTVPRTVLEACKCSQDHQREAGADNSVC